MEDANSLRDAGDIGCVRLVGIFISCIPCGLSGVVFFVSGVLFAVYLLLVLFKQCHYSLHETFYSYSRI